MSRFILFRGSSLYGSIDRMLDSLAAAFVAGGDQSVIIDATRPDYVAVLQANVAQGVDAFIGLTGIGLDLRAENNLYNSLDVPLVSWYLDPLLLYWNQVATPIRRRLILTTAPDDVPYWAGTLKMPAPIHHLPHAADPLPDSAIVPWDQRDVEILFSGTAPPNPAALRAAWAQHGSAVEARLNNMLDAHDANPFVPLAPLIAQVAHPVARLEDPQSLYPYFSTLDLYLRARARWDTARALMAAPTSFVGPGWETVAAAADGPVAARFLGEKPAAEVAELTRRARIVVNTCTPYHGTHERVFQAMAAGAMSLTSETAWLAANAPEGTLVSFRAGRDDVATLAAASETIALAGRRWHGGAHTWRCRALAIKGYLAA